MIDWDRIAELEAEFGPAEFAEVLELFMEEVEAVIGRLDGPVTPEDLHFLKGCALNLGFRAFGRLCDPPPGADPPEAVALRARYAASKATFLSDPRMAGWRQTTKVASVSSSVISV